jgi:hypothetical protein
MMNKRTRRRVGPAPFFCASVGKDHRWDNVLVIDGSSGFRELYTTIICAGERATVAVS